MGLDIRLPIGLMFSILGVMLTGFGLVGDKASINVRSGSTSIYGGESCCWFLDS